MSEPFFSFVNGQITNSIHIKDRGLAFGDGVFETILFKQDNLFLWSLHIKRLKKGCQLLGFVAPDANLLLKETQELITTNQLTECIIKIIVTRGLSERGYQSNKAITPNRIITIYPLDSLDTHIYKQGMNATICNTRLSHNPKLAGIKHLNRLEQVLAANELNRDIYFDGIMLDYQNNLIEGTRHNIFLKMKDNYWYTPSLEACGIEGVMRDYILYESALSTHVKIATINQDKIKSIQSAFFCNSVYGVIPICCIDDHEMIIDTTIESFIHSMQNGLLEAK